MPDCRKNEIFCTSFILSITNVAKTIGSCKVDVELKYDTRPVRFCSLFFASSPILRILLHFEQLLLRYSIQILPELPI